MKIYKWEWYIVFSRREERDVAQGSGGFSQRVHLTYTITPLYVLYLCSLIRSSGLTSTT